VGLQKHHNDDKTIFILSRILVENQLTDKKFHRICIKVSFYTFGETSFDQKTADV
jgi:hypothetical protein